MFHSAKQVDADQKSFLEKQRRWADTAKICRSYIADYANWCTRLDNGSIAGSFHWNGVTVVAHMDRAMADSAGTVVVYPEQASAAMARTADIAVRTSSATEGRRNYCLNRSTSAPLAQSYALAISESAPHWPEWYLMRDRPLLDQIHYVIRCRFLSAAKGLRFIAATASWVLFATRYLRMILRACTLTVDSDMPS